MSLQDALSVRQEEPSLRSLDWIAKLYPPESISVWGTDPFSDAADAIAAAPAKPIAGDTLPDLAAYLDDQVKSYRAMGNKNADFAAELLADAAEAAREFNAIAEKGGVL
jgi:hypothetical protein